MMRNPLLNIYFWSVFWGFFRYNTGIIPVVDTSGIKRCADFWRRLSEFVHLRNRLHKSFNSIFAIEFAAKHCKFTIIFNDFARPTKPDILIYLPLDQDKTPQKTRYTTFDAAIIKTYALMKDMKIFYDNVRIELVIIGFFISVKSLVIETFHNWKVDFPRLEPIWMKWVLSNQRSNWKCSK